MYMYYTVSTFDSSHPSIIVFLNVIWQIHAVNYIKIRHISDVAPQSKIEEKLDFLLDLWRKYHSGQITREIYIRCVGYKYQARTDM